MPHIQKRNGYQIALQFLLEEAQKAENNNLIWIVVLPKICAVYKGKSELSWRKGTWNAARKLTRDPRLIDYCNNNGIRFLELYSLMKENDDGSLKRIKPNLKSGICFLIAPTSNFMAFKMLGQLREYSEMWCSIFLYSCDKRDIVFKTEKAMLIGKANKLPKLLSATDYERYGIKFKEEDKNLEDKELFNKIKQFALKLLIGNAQTN